MDSDKKEFGLWWVWVMLLVIVTGTVLTVTGAASRVFGVRVEREVLKQSHQYREARDSELTTYEAQLAELRAQLAHPDVTEAQRADIEAQMASIRVLMGAARRRQ